MTPESMFDRAVNSSRKDRKNLIAFLEDFTDAQAEWKPPDGEWSIAEGVEHILMTDEWVREYMAGALKEAEAKGAWDTAPDEIQKLTGEQLRRREQGSVPAPDHLLPRGGQKLSGMRERLPASREAVLDALRPFRAFGMRRLILRPSRYGDQNVYDRIEYTGIHDHLHQEQMERAARLEGFPKEGGSKKQG